MGVLLVRKRVNGMGKKKAKTPAKKYRSARPTIPAAVKAHVARGAGNECQYPGCGANEGLFEIHHIDGDRTHNVPSNLVVLCPNHHEEADRGEISVWRLRWYNRRSSIIAFVRALFPFAFRKPKDRPARVLEVASGHRKRLTLGIFLLLMFAGCLIGALAVFFWR